MRGIHKLTGLGVAKLHRPGYYGDGGGLVLQVSPSGTKSWIFRHQLEGKRHEIGLGPCSVVELADAGELARICRQLLRKRLDPLRPPRCPRSARGRKSPQPDVRPVRRCIHRAHRGGWRNPKHAAQ